MAISSIWAVRFLALVAAATGGPPWLATGERCVDLVNSVGAPNESLVEVWAKLRDAEDDLKLSRAPSEDERRAFLTLGHPARGSTLASLALHGVHDDEVLEIVLEQYSERDSFAIRYYTFRLLGQMTREQVLRYSNPFSRAVRREPSHLVVVQVGGAIGNLELKQMIDLLYKLSIEGGPVASYLIAKEAGRVKELKEALESKGARCALHVVRDLEFKQSQVGWPVESLAAPEGCGAR